MKGKQNNQNNESDFIYKQIGTIHLSDVNFAQESLKQNILRQIRYFLRN